MRNADSRPSSDDSGPPLPPDQAYLAEPVPAAGPIAVPARLPEYLVDRIGDLVLVLERGGTIRYANATAESSLGWTPARMLGKLVTYYLHPEDAPAAVARFSRMLTQPGESLAVEVRFRHLDGSWRHFEAVGTNLLGSEIADGIVVTCRDVSARRFAEAQVETAGRRFRRLVEYSHDSIAVIAADGTLLYNSPAEVRRLGFSDEENLGKNVFELIHPEDAARVRGVLDGALGEPGCTRFMEFRVRQADARWRWVEAVGRNLLHDPDVAGLVVNFRDISERRAATEALRRKDELLQHARKFEALGRLAGGVAHDFNNLLTVIKGYAQMLRRQLGDGHPQAPDVEEIVRATDRAADMTGQLRAFSRGQLLHPEVVELNGVLREAARMITTLVGERIAVRVDLPSATAWVRADPAQLQRVLLNLAANARDAMPAGGTLEIAARLEPPRTEDAPGPAAWAVITVTDTGTGMDAATLAHLYEPFFSTKGAGHGTGLGLATTYGIVAQSGGRIEATSEPGRGTAFRVALPAVTAPAPSAVRAASGPRAARGGETILLVEDIANVRAMTRRMLAAGGYRVLAAADADDAVRLAGETAGPIDLLLTDVQMPGRDGLALARELAAARPGLRVMFMSSLVDRETALAASGLVGARFLDKPFDEGALLATVREALDGG